MPYSDTVVVRAKFGREMEGIELHENGVTFRSAVPMAKGTVLEVVLCRGSILVDVEVVHCEAVLEDPRVYTIRVRYLHTSRDLVEFIAEEASKPDE